MATTPGEPYAWLHGSSMRAASDACLGVIALITGMVAIQAATSFGLGSAARLEAGSYPFVIGWLLLAVGVAALLRAVVLRNVEHARWGLISIAVIAVVILAIHFAARQWGSEFALLFGPAELVARIVLELAVAIALVRSSRIRALGMVLLGLLIATIGLDVSTDYRMEEWPVERFMGRDSLFGPWGVDPTTVVIGFAVADGVLGAVSPSLLLASYARKVGHRLATSLRLPVDLILRVAGALLIAAALYGPYTLEGVWLVEQIAVFAVLGMACQMFDWNRLVLLIALILGPLLEEKIRQTHLLAQGDFGIYWARPISATVLALAVAIIVVATMLSAWLSLSRRRPASG